MATVIVVRRVLAPAEVVFRTVADARRFAHAISGVVKVEFLSETTSGVGARFRYDGKAFARRRDYMSILQCRPDGAWRISHRQWSDHPRTPD